MSTVVDVARELNALIAELAGWREIGLAIQRVDVEHPGYSEPIERARQEIRAERVAAVAEVTPTSPETPKAIRTPARRRPRST